MGKVTVLDHKTGVKRDITVSEDAEALILTIQELINQIMRR